jgi:hypothetical protein
MPAKYSNTIKTQVLESIQKGELTPAQASKQYAVHIKTIYGWISSGSGGVDPNLFKIKKLQREKEDLLKIIGALTVVVEEFKKKDKQE